jgi:hypothetical protein
MTGDGRAGVGRAGGEGEDPKGLVREAYAIEGITDGECRSILVDWALSLAAGADAGAALRALVARYGPAHPGHPMTAVLEEGLAPPPVPRRRGGRSGRRAAEGPAGAGF